MLGQKQFHNYLNALVVAIAFSKTQSETEEVFMFDKIIAATDSSKAGKRVFEKALNLAKLTGASLMVLHVLCPDEEGCPDPLDPLEVYYPGKDKEAAERYQKKWEKFSQKGLEMVQSFVAKATAAGVSAECNQISGEPGQTICEIAHTWKAALIVIGRRRWLSGLERLVLGSVSNYVLHHASCSVLTVQ